MINDILQGLQIGVAVLTGAATALLGFMFWNSSLTNTQIFTTRFLKFLSLCSVLKAVEIACAIYRTSRIDPASVPIDATIAALIGRGIEAAGYCAMVWFLLRPETKKALNGGGASLTSKSGEMHPDFWRQEFRLAVRSEVKEEFLNPPPLSG